MNIVLGFLIPQSIADNEIQQHVYVPRRQDMTMFTCEQSLTQCLSDDVQISLKLPDSHSCVRGL